MDRASKKERGTYRHMHRLKHGGLVLLRKKKRKGKDRKEKKIMKKKRKKNPTKSVCCGHGTS